MSSSYEYRGCAKGVQNSNYSDYYTNTCYNALRGLVDQNGKPIPYYGTVKPGSQIVPAFANVNYINPNYNSLTLGMGACANQYPTITDGYYEDKNNCVKYLARPCDKTPKGCM
jgi:hypothetical protein